MTDEVAAFFEQYASATRNDYGIPVDKATVFNPAGEVLFRGDVVGSSATTWAQLFRVLMLAFARTTCESFATCKYQYSADVREVLQGDSKVEMLLIDDTGGCQNLVADLVIGADGASSRVREIVFPDTERKYAGYVALRGLLPVEELSHETRTATDRSATFCWTRDSSALSYTVPANKNVPPDSHKLLNWVWYQPKTKEELAVLMTDVTGKTHAITLPEGGMTNKEAEQIRSKAQIQLAPPFAEAVGKTKGPFVQVITDTETSENVLWDRKLLFVGDSAAGQRPHTASAVTQACLHAHLLRLHLQGQLTALQWSQETRIISSTLVKVGQELGAITLSTDIDPADKARLHFSKSLPCEKLLTEKWAAFSLKDGIKM